MYIPKEDIFIVAKSFGLEVIQGVSSREAFAMDEIRIIAFYIL